MDEWIDGCIDRQRDRQTDGQLDGYIMFTFDQIAMYSVMCQR